MEKSAVVYLLLSADMKLECIISFHLYCFGEISGLPLLNKLPVCIALIAVLWC